MIELLLILAAIKYRHGFSLNADESDAMDRALEPGAGLDYEPPERKRPELRIVKCLP